MSRLTTWCVLIFLLLGGFSASAAEDPPQRVAGRSLAAWQRVLDSEDRTERLLAAKTLAAFGTPAAPVLAEALTAEDAGVRYIAAVSLGRLGGPALSDNVDTLQVLREDAEHPAVQMAAAFALCRAGQVDEQLSFLAERLEHKERAMAVSSAELLGMLGPAAQPAVAALERAQAANRPGSKGDYHIGGAATNALRKIQPTGHPSSPRE